MTRSRLKFVPGPKSGMPAKVLWFLSIGLVIYLSLTPRIELPYDFSGADKLGHFMAYLWLGILPFFALEPRRRALAGALLMILLGMGLEFAQISVPGRNFSVADMAANAAGVISGIFLAGRARRFLLASFVK